MNELIKDMEPSAALLALAKGAKKSGNKSFFWSCFEKHRENKRKARLQEQSAKALNL